MKLSRILPLTLVPLVASLAAAQDAPNNPNAENPNNRDAPPAATRATDGAARVVQIDAENLAGLAALLERGGIGAVSLRVSQEEFEADKAANAALLSYVQAGGVVFLHTGAARDFGFQTVPARLGSNAAAGQLYGRSSAALPFGAHPLLADDGQSQNQNQNQGRRAPGADPTQLPGVNVVFYEMQEGDHLVQSHPAGTALLEVRDLASNAQNTLFAAALAPFGRGFAVFTPDVIDQKRGDGALFARNLLRLLGGSAPLGNGAAPASERLIAVPAGVVQRGATATAALQRALLEASAGAPSPALPAFGTLPDNRNPFNPAGQTPMTPPMDTPETQAAPQVRPHFDGLPPEAMPSIGPPGVAGPPNDNADNDGAAGAGNLNGDGGNDVGNEGADGDQEAVEANPDAAVLLLTSSEARAYASLLTAGDERAGAAINLLRARLFLSRGDTRQASRAVEAAAGLAPNNAEIALWRGVLTAGAAQIIAQPSPVRAQLLQTAARDFGQAVGSPSLMLGVSNAANAGAARVQRGGNARQDALTGISTATLRFWSTKMGQIARVFDLEPPSVQTFGVGSGAITVRAVKNDGSLLLILPAIQALSNARNFGWHGDNEEILLFPNAQTLLDYRRALGLTQPTAPLPAGAYGDVVGQRISLVALNPVTISTRNPVTGLNMVRPGANSGLDVLARLHSYVLLGAYDESAQSPLWLQLGLENLINTIMVGNQQVISNALILEQTAAAGGLLTLEQFGGGILSVRPDRMLVAQAQSASLMDYFYRKFGAGAVTETVQRVGMGQTIDDALLATTEGDQIALFNDWRRVQFGLRGFPNRG